MYGTLPIFSNDGSIFSKETIKGQKIWNELSNLKQSKHVKDENLKMPYVIVQFHVLIQNEKYQKNKFIQFILMIRQSNEIKP